MRQAKMKMRLSFSKRVDRLMADDDAWLDEMRRSIDQLMESNLQAKLPLPSAELDERPDQLIFRFDSALSHEPEISQEEERANGPILGEILLCLFVPLDKQDERIGDFNEKYSNRWEPRYGPQVAKFIYLWNALKIQSECTLMRGFWAIADRIARRFRF